MTERKIRSKRQAEASRQNGAKSAGPASKEGKEKSAQNSKKHGLTGKIEPSSTEQDYLDELLCKLHARYDANDAQQAILIERAVTAELRLIRARTLITSTLEDIADPENPRRVAKQQLVALTIKTTRDHLREMFGGAAPSLSLARMVAEEAGWINAMPRANRAALTKLVRYAQRFRGERDRALIRLEAMIDYGLWRYRRFANSLFFPVLRKSQVFGVETAAISILKINALQANSLFPIIREFMRPYQGKARGRIEARRALSVRGLISDKGRSIPRRVVCMECAGRLTRAALSTLAAASSINIERWRRYAVEEEKRSRSRLRSWLWQATQREPVQARTNW